jgi:hypothetical protein
LLFFFFQKKKVKREKRPPFFENPDPMDLFPRGLTGFLAWPVKDLILRFRTILAGFVNFYSFADNIGSLIFIYHLLHGALKKTICRKMDILAASSSLCSGQISQSTSVVRMESELT